jgi:hypothetical protein
VGRSLEIEGAAQIRVLAQQCDEASVIDFKESLEDQAGEELRLAINMRTMAMRIHPQDLLPGAIGLNGHP